MDARVEGFGALLRRWRRQRGFSQLALALAAEVSPRHLSWLETGRAGPSRAMVLRLAEQLQVPLRERNAWLQAAGFAPMFAERALADPALAGARAALQRLLDAHEPWPALVVDRHWNLVAHNRLVPLLLAELPPEWRSPPLNVLRLSLHPRGLAPLIRNLPAWRAHVLARLRRQLAASAGDPALQQLLAELQAFTPAGEAGGPGGGEQSGPGGAAAEHGAGDVAVPLLLRTRLGDLAFITTLTVFGAPHDITLSELAMETLLPADEVTAATLRAQVLSP